MNALESFLTLAALLWAPVLFGVGFCLSLTGYAHGFLFMATAMLIGVPAYANFYALIRRVY